MSGMFVPIMAAKVLDNKISFLHHLAWILHFALKAGWLTFYKYIIITSLVATCAKKKPHVVLYEAILRAIKHKILCDFAIPSRAPFY